MVSKSSSKLATERELDKIVAATTREKRPLVNAGEIGVRVGKVLNRFKVGKHFQIDIGSGQFSYERNLANIKTEAALDGLYVIRTSVEKQKLDAKETVKIKDYLRFSQSIPVLKS